MYYKFFSTSKKSDIIEKYKLQTIEKEEIINLFWENTLINLYKKHWFYIHSIFKTNENDFIFEVDYFKNNINFWYWAVLSNAQKEVFKLNTKYNIIFIPRDIKSIKPLNYDKNKIKYELILKQELEKLKYWKKLKDKLSFIPRPEVINYFHKNWYDINSVINQDENILTREFIRWELISLRSAHHNLGKSKNFLEKGIIIQAFDKINNLDKNTKIKLKNSYIKAIQILQLLFLLNKKWYLKQENIFLKRNHNSEYNTYNWNIKKVLNFFPKEILEILWYSKIKQITEKEFLEILDNPELKIKELEIQNNTKYKIEKLKIDTWKDWKNFYLPSVILK